MARRLLVALLPALVGLGLLADASVPLYLFGMPFHHAPMRATVVDNAVEELGNGQPTLGMCTPRWHYVFEGRPYDASIHAGCGVQLRDPQRRTVGDLRAGDTTDIWIDPKRPAAASLHRDGYLGNDPGQTLLGLALVFVGIAMAGDAATRRRRRGGRPTA